MNSEEERPPSLLRDFRRSWGSSCNKESWLTSPTRGPHGSDGKAISCWAPGSPLSESQKLSCLISDTGDEGASANHWKGSLKALKPSSREGESRSVVSNSLWPLYSPWNSPGQNTGVDSHSPLQGICPTQDRTQVSHIAGGFFTSWAITEAQEY